MNLNKIVFPISTWILGLLLLLNNAQSQSPQGQDQPEEMIKLREEKVTDLDIKRSEVNREYNYLTNAVRSEKLFDEEITLGLSEKGGESRDFSLSPRINYFRILVGQDYYFLGEFDYSQSLNQDLGDWFTINFAGLSHRNLSSLLSGDIVENSDKHRFDVTIFYQFPQEGDNGNSYLHTLEGEHTSYNKELQGFNTTNDELFYYHLRFGYKGYYLFPSLALDHSLSLGGGKYYATSVANFDNSGFIESGYNLELRGRNAPLNGLYGNFAFDFDWLRRQPEQGGSENYRFLLGLGLGYDWKISPTWILSFYLGHLTEIIKTSDDVLVDSFMPIVVLPKFGLTYHYSQQMRFTFEGGLKSETENLRDLYGRESLHHQRIFPYFHHLAEGKISFRYDGADILNGLELDIFALYNYFFEYDRVYYRPGQLKGLVEEEGIARVAIGVKSNLQILSWLAWNQQAIYNINFPIDRLFFPRLENKSRLIFWISKIHSRFILSYFNTIAEIYSHDGGMNWKLSTQRLDLGYEFEYNHIMLEISVENILDKINYNFPGIREKGFTVLGGISYFF